MLSRALVLAILVFAREDGVSGDVTYYATSLHQLFSGAGLGNTLQEYPLPVLLILLPPFLLGLLNQVAFKILLFALSMLLVDAAFTDLLWRGDGRRRGDAVNLWLWFVPALGPLAYFRFDLVPAVLAGGAVLAAIRRPRLAGVAHRDGRRARSCGRWSCCRPSCSAASDRKPVLVGFLVTGVIVGGLSLADRRLAAHAVPAALAVRAGPADRVDGRHPADGRPGRCIRSGCGPSDFSRYKAFEIFGAGTKLMIAVTSVLTLLGGLLLILLWYRSLEDAHSLGGDPGLAVPGHRADRHRHEQDPQPAVPAVAGRPDRRAGRAGTQQPGGTDVRPGAAGDRGGHPVDLSDRL